MDLYMLNWSFIWHTEDMCTLSQYFHQQYTKLATSPKKNHFFKDISISYGLNSQEILNLSDASAID